MTQEQYDLLASAQEKLIRGGLDGLTITLTREERDELLDLLGCEFSFNTVETAGDA
jgi:hypothetical protein